MKAVNLLPWREQRQRQQRRRFALAMLGGVLGGMASMAGHAVILAVELRDLRAASAAESRPVDVAATAPAPVPGATWRVVREEYQRLARESAEDIRLDVWRLTLPDGPTSEAALRVVLRGTARNGRTVGRLLQRWQPPGENGTLDWEETPANAGGGRRFTLTIRKRTEGPDDGA